MAPATEQMVFDVLVALFKAGIQRYEDMQSGKTTAAQAHAEISSIVATLGGATSGSDQMANVAEDAKFETTTPPPASPEG